MKSQNLRTRTMYAPKRGVPRPATLAIAMVMVPVIARLLRLSAGRGETSTPSLVIIRKRRRTGEKRAPLGELSVITLIAQR